MGASGAGAYHATSPGRANDASSPTSQSLPPTWERWDEEEHDGDVHELGAGGPYCTPSRERAPLAPSSPPRGTDGGDLDESPRSTPSRARAHASPDSSVLRPCNAPPEAATMSANVHRVGRSQASEGGRSRVGTVLPRHSLAEVDPDTAQRRNASSASVHASGQSRAALARARDSSASTAAESVRESVHAEHSCRSSLYGRSGCAPDHDV